MHPAMNFSHIDTEGLSYVADFARMSLPPNPRLEVERAGIPCSIYSAIFTRKTLDAVDGFSKNDWVVAVQFYDDFHPTTGTQVQNIKNARTGADAQWRNLTVRFVQPMGPRYYHLWVAEAK